MIDRADAYPPCGTYAGEGELARIVKLCHNLFPGAIAVPMAKIITLAGASGVGRETLLACRNNSVVGTAFTQYKSSAYVNLDFEPTFTSKQLRKDSGPGRAAERERDVPVPVASINGRLAQGMFGDG